MSEAASQRIALRRWTVQGSRSDEGTPRRRAVGRRKILLQHHNVSKKPPTSATWASPSNGGSMTHHQDQPKTPVSLSTTIASHPA
jgi:hypothetical protein